MILPLIASVTETGAGRLSFVISIAESSHASILFALVSPAGRFLRTAATTACSLLGNGGSGTATRAVEVILLAVVAIKILRCEATSERLRFVEAVVVVVVTSTHSRGLTPGWRFLVEIGGTTRLLG